MSAMVPLPHDNTAFGWGWAWGLARWPESRQSVPTKLYSRRTVRLLEHFDDFTATSFSAMLAVSTCSSALPPLRRSRGCPAGLVAIGSSLLVALRLLVPPAVIRVGGLLSCMLACLRPFPVVKSRFRLVLELAATPRAWRVCVCGVCGSAIPALAKAVRGSLPGTHHQLRTYVSLLFEPEP